MGRVEIVTLTVGARAKEGKGGGGGEEKIHLLLSSGSFNTALSRANCALKENARTAGYPKVNPFIFSQILSNNSSRKCIKITVENLFVDLGILHIKYRFHYVYCHPFYAGLR